jgi:nucleotide-binding universal stress UspA family protein
MLEIKLILCPVDFSEFSIRAYHYALSLAEHYRAQMVVQNIVELSRYPYADYVASQGDYAEFCRALHEGGKEKLREFVEKHTHDEIQLELVVNEGAAADSILSLAQARNVDLIVMGTHGRRGFDRLVLGSVTDRVMRTARCPVLAISKAPHESAALDSKVHESRVHDSAHESVAYDSVPHEPRAKGEERGHVHHLSRILFCTDFSRNAERALNYAISVTTEYNAELTLLHVLEEAPSPAKGKEAIATATEQLDKLIVSTERKNLKVKTVVRIGKPYQEIIQLAVEAQIDTVIMGVSGRGALDRAVFGSTTYRVMQLGPCPVLAVPVLNR